MSGDRRKSDSRRSSDRRAGDRRAPDADRRNTGGRRNVDSAAKSARSAKAAAPAAPEESSTPVAEIVQKLIKRLAVLFVILVAIFTVILVYFFSHFDYYMDRLAQQIKIENTKATIDPGSLTDRTTRANLMLEVYNQLPVRVALQNLKLNVKIGGYTAAKGVQVVKRVVIEARQKQFIQVQFHVDSIMARRGLQKAVQQNAAPLLRSLISRVQGKKTSLADDIKGIMTSDGSAEFRLLIGGMEIPFERRFRFGGS